MKKGGVSGRTRDLEEQFFQQRDKELLKALHKKMADEERKKSLAESSGIADEKLLDQLLKLDVTADTVAAFSLVPLIAVAWADGSIDPRERIAVLEAAEGQGIGKDQRAYHLLSGWLKRKPDANLLDAWKIQVGTLSAALGEASLATLKAELLGRARAIAETAGGLLGFGSKISKTEQAVLDELEQAFG